MLSTFRVRDIEIGCLSIELVITNRLVVVRFIPSHLSFQIQFGISRKVFIPKCSPPSCGYRPPKISLVCLLSFPRLSASDPCTARHVAMPAEISRRKHRPTRSSCLVISSEGHVPKSIALTGIELSLLRRPRGQDFHNFYEKLQRKL